MQSLYRKYRPQSFDELIGQERIVNTLQPALKNKTFAHAYLFAGPRGTGKTSTARILARELGVNPEDLYEIDAASNRSIDDIRELREAVTAPPYTSEYKMYIMDEAHMLTKEAWNALLKTLEEPPHYVVFVLATTELHKIPETILSRVETHHFASPSQEHLSEVLVGVAKKEGYSLDKEGAALLAENAGSYRDALGTLQQVMSASKDKKLTKKEVERVISKGDMSLAATFLTQALGGEYKEALATIKQFETSPEETLRFIHQVTDTGRKALLAKVEGEEHELAPKMSSIIMRKLLEAEIASRQYPHPLMALELFVAGLQEEK